MSKQLDKLQKDLNFIKQCEIDLGRHTAIEILTEQEEAISSTAQTKLDELLLLVTQENEVILKHIMKVCFCSKPGAEHLLDELIDKIGADKPDAYFIGCAELTAFFESEGFEID